MTANEWNELYPVGTRVRYYSIMGETTPKLDTRTRSEAWELGHGAPIVKVEGVTGGVSLYHLWVLPSERPAKESVHGDEK